MAVKLVIQESFPAADYFTDAGLIELVKYPPFPPCIATVGKGNCACNTNHELIVHDKCIFFQGEENQLNTFSGYQLDGQFSEQESITVLTWLTQTKFYTFQSCIENGTFNRHLSRNLFQEMPSSCKHCYQYRLKGKPVFCLKSIVVSGKNKGPTLESVLIPCQKKLF